MRITHTPEDDYESSAVQLALLNHRMETVERSITDLYAHKNANVHKLSYVSGVVSVLSVIGTVLFGYFYDKFVK